MKKDFFPAALLLTGLFVLSSKFLPLWFISDDTSCIFASSLNPLKLLFDRDTYLLFNKMFYTPFIPLSFRLDYMLFGLRPFGYHVHNLFAAFVTAVMAYKVYRLYLPRFEAWAGTFLFALSYPVITNIGWITCRSYLWGTFFVLAAFYFFRKAELQKSLPMRLLSYIFFVVALLFKEAFAPVAAIVFLLAEDGFREKTLKSLPYFLLFACFLAFRTYMIGGLGGYIGALPSPEPVSLFKSYFSQLGIVSQTVWGVPMMLLAPIFVILFLTRKRTAAASVVFLVLTTAPFIFLKLPETIDAYYRFYFPPKFMLPLFVFSGSAACLLSYSGKRMKALALILVGAILVLQVLHAGDAYAFIRQSAESYRRLTAGALSRNSQGEKILIVHEDAIFYNFYYAGYAGLINQRKTGLGQVVTVDRPDVAALLSDKGAEKEMNSVFLGGKWLDGDSGGIFDAGPHIESSIPKPAVSLEMNGRFVSFTVTDRRGGVFYGALRSVLSPKNIAIQSMILPKQVPLRFGLVKGKEVVYLFYCEGGRCSEPIVIEPDGGR